MKKNKIYIFGTIGVLLLVLLFVWSTNNQPKDSISDMTKVALRDVGHQLLLAANDSTSLVLPIKVLDNNNYQLSFKNNISILPDQLQELVQTNFKKANLPENYLVEILFCSTKNVLYSYSKKEIKENSIIPCRGRLFPKDCYIIQVKFLVTKNTFSMFKIAVYGLLCLLFILVVIRFSKKEIHQQTNLNKEVENRNYNTIGSYKFYPDQHKLIKEAVEIKLSNKECEILAIFVANPNQIIKRDELSKRVWEDNGVIVGRSLDTYISKLRKKLKEDAAIQITNIHGVGYKLEILEL